MALSRRVEDVHSALDMRIFLYKVRILKKLEIFPKSSNRTEDKESTLCSGNGIYNMEHYHVESKSSSPSSINMRLTKSWAKGSNLHKNICSMLLFT